MQDVIQAEQVFDGHVLHPRAAVVVADGRVVSLAPADPARPVLPGVLMPGFVDVQVNGGGGALLGELDLALREQTGLSISIADQCLNCVALGTGKALEYEKQLRHVIDYES